MQIRSTMVRSKMVKRKHLLSLLALLVLLSLHPQTGWAKSDGGFPGKGNYNAWINANSFLQFGNKSASEGNLDQAIDYYKKAINLYGFDSTFYLNLGNALAIKNDFNLAEQSFARATELEPNYYQAWLNLGHMSMKLGKFAEAIDELEKASKLAPSPSDKAAIAQTISQLRKLDNSSQADQKHKKKKKKKKS